MPCQSHPATVLPSLRVGFRVGAQVGDAICLPSIVPRVLTSVLTSSLKQIRFPTRSRAPVPGTSFDCFRSFSEQRCWQPALNHPLSAGILDLSARADRRRCNTIERHHSSPTGVSHPGDRERRKVRYERFNRRSSHVAVWYPVAGDKRRDRPLRDSPGQ
jgi:hypothetical protein